MTNSSIIPSPATPPAPARSATTPLRVTLYAVAAVQAVLGVGFLVSPAGLTGLLGLPAAPGWTGWLFGQLGARFLGYAVGMAVAARDPERHRLWIDTMIGIQVIDWVVTVAHLLGGDVRLAQVTTAPFLPVLFVAGLAAWRPRRSAHR